MRKKMMGVLWAFVMVLLAGYMIPSPAVGIMTSDPVLSIQDMIGQRGESIQIPINLNSAGQVSGMEFCVSYNPAFIQYQSTLAGALSSGFSLFANPLLDENTAKIKVIIVNFSGKKIPSGSGIIATLNFVVANNAVAGQSTTMNLSGVVLADAQGEKIPNMELINGQFQVAAVSAGSSAGEDSDDANSTEVGSAAASTTDLQPTTAPAAKSLPGFSDLLDSHWAAGIIVQLCQDGMVSGYPDGTFQTEKNISRAEFIKIMATVLNLNMDGLPAHPSFGDVPQSSWCYPYVEAAAKAGLINGAGKKFLPDAKISRQEIAIILVRGLGRSSQVVNLSAKIPTGFADDQAIASWARGYVVTALQDGLISGYPEDHTFRSEKYATRAESCAMISRFRAMQAAAAN